MGTPIWLDPLGLFVVPFVILCATYPRLLGWLVSFATFLFAVRIVGGLLLAL